jgi:hypothetical protein
VPDEVVSVVDSFLLEVCLKVLGRWMWLWCMCVKGRPENEDVSGGDRSICIQALEVVLINAFQVKKVLALSFVQNN